MTVGSLFAGIGGFDLGFERAGYEIKWQVEINGFCRAVLRKHWPQVRKYADVRRVGAHNLEPVDVICGGFPCQDISPAGRRAGIEGERSGLWREYARVIGELRPSYAVVENSAALLQRGIGRVCGSLAELGYDARWDVVSACAFGAPHARERVFLIANSNRARWENGVNYQLWNALQAVPAHWKATEDKREWERMECWLRTHFQDRHGAHDTGDIFGVDDGLSPELDAHRVKAAGNAIVPQIAEWIAHRIQEAEALR